MRSATIRTLVTNVTILGLGLINSVLLARWLGPESRGEVAAAMLWPSMLIYLSNLGQPAAIIYHLGKAKFTVEELLGNVLVLAVVQSILAYGVGFLVIPWLLSQQNVEAVNASRLYLSAIPLGLISLYSMSVLQSSFDFQIYNALRVIQPFGYLVATIFLKSLNELSLLPIILAQILVLVLLTVTAVVMVLYRGSIRRLSFNWELAHQMLIFGTKAHIGSLSQMANLRLDQALMAAWLSAYNLGLYVVGVSAASLLQSYSSAFQMVITPNIAHCETNKERVNYLTRFFSRYWFGKIVLAGILLLMLPTLIPILFGNEYHDSIVVAQILTIAGVALGAYSVLSSATISMGYPWISSRADLIGLILTLVFLPYALPTFGIIGAAVVSLAVYMIQLIALLHNLTNTVYLPLDKIFIVRSKDARYFVDLSLQSIQRYFTPRR